jgi:predicted 3-demethylubiquinone-9 3-methyltransferase (glyoxalase superfamily)
MATNNDMLAANSGQQISPFLWFDGRVEEAVNFYTSIFKNSEILTMSHLPGDAPGVKGPAQMAVFKLNGLEFMILNAGPMYKPNPAISFFIKCETQEEVDHYWDRLLEGGQPSQCGWLQDKFGISWQVVPNALGRLMGDPDRVKARKVMQAMMKMIKLDIGGLEAAYNS